MPAKNRIKEYASDSFYHIYNRGVNKERIFTEEKDYAVFLSYLKTYLLPKDDEYLHELLADANMSWREKDKAKKLLRMNNFEGEIKLISFVLMPNHFHLFIWQKEMDSMDKFMNSLCTRYSMYRNKQNKRIGPVFQGVYKAVHIVSEEQSIYLSRYIHRNPMGLLASQGLALRSYEYSSYSAYLGERKIDWLCPEIVLNNFSNTTFSYENFVEGNVEEEKSRSILKMLELD